MTLDLRKYVFTRDEIRTQRYPWTPGSGGDGPGVYFLFMRYALTYIGKSGCVAARMRAHVMNGVDRRTRIIPFDRFAWIDVPEDLLAAVELFYIERDRPPYNLKDNPGVLGGKQWENANTGTLGANVSPLHGARGNR